MNIRELKLRNKKVCDCGHEFSNDDIQPPIIKNEDHRFYGGRVEYYTKVKCKECGKEVYLFLEAYDNKYRVIDTAEGEQEVMEADTTVEMQEEYKCEKCDRVFKNKQGLSAHSRKCQSN